MEVDELIDTLTKMKVKKLINGDEELFVYDKWQNEISIISDVLRDENDILEIII